MATRRPQRGFTLLEVMVALALVTLISLVVMGSVGPWLALKQRMDNERKMQDLKNGITALYSAKAFAIEQQTGPNLDAFTNSAFSGGLCNAQLDAFIANADRFSEPPQQMVRDGYSNPWCIAVSSPTFEIKDGVKMWYRNINFVSGGPDGLVTSSWVNEKVVLDGDDLVLTVSGRDIQAEKLKETLRRMNRVGQLFETYFTTRYLANPNRDITVYYFNNLSDLGGTVGSSGGNWAKAAVLLQPVGVGPTDAATPWERENSIEVANYNEKLQTEGYEVRTPLTSGAGVLPYTALLRARVPSPADAPLSYAVQTVIGNY